LDLYHPKKGDLAEVYSWEMKNLNLYKPHFEQIFTGPFTPGGYAYIFPKSKTTANIGVGGIISEKKIEKYFEEFLEINHVRKQIKNAKYVVEKSKMAVYGDLTEKWIYGNVILVGDTANQNLKPFIEGILPSIICGDIIGKLVHEIFTQKNITHLLYLNKVKKTLKDHFEITKQLQELIKYIFSKKGLERFLLFYGLITESIDFDNPEIEKLSYQELKKMLQEKINEM
jgi:flavin-dependent dehydrogenase